jgi:hypothetical protein
MRRRVVDLNGRVFGRLSVVRRGTDANDGHASWLCRCECGTETTVRSNRLLRDGGTRSCGCMAREASAARKRTHGRTHTVEFETWTRMKARCFDDAHPDFGDYGGRGIIVCERWLGEHGFENFLADMGERPSRAHSIDRFPDNHGNYEPGNCRWATMRQQQNNRRSNRLVTFDGRTMTTAQWARERCLSPQLLYWRLSHGWDIADALAPPRVS